MTMSAPPMNSPSRYSCGMVGQLLNSYVEHTSTRRDESDGWNFGKYTTYKIELVGGGLQLGPRTFS